MYERGRAFHQKEETRKTFQKRTWHAKRPTSRSRMLARLRAMLAHLLARGRVKKKSAPVPNRELPRGRTMTLRASLLAPKVSESMSCGVERVINRVKAASHEGRRWGAAATATNGNAREEATAPRWQLRRLARC